MFYDQLLPGMGSLIRRFAVPCMATPLVGALFSHLFALPRRAPGASRRQLPYLFYFLVFALSYGATPVSYTHLDVYKRQMVHSGIKNVGVITQKNYSSLMDHIGSGREWDLHGKQGLVMLPPFLTRENMGVYSGLLDALKSNSTYLRLSRQEYIVLTNSHTIYNMDYTDALKFHMEKGADMTVLYAHGAKAVGTEGENDTFLSVDEEGKVTGMEIGSSVPTRDCASLKVYITKRELLRQLVEQAAANGMHDFDRDILQRNINDGNLKVYGYEYKGLACQIDSIQSYFNFNLSLIHIFGTTFTRVPEAISISRASSSAACSASLRPPFSVLISGKFASGENPLSGRPIFCS